MNIQAFETEGVPLTDYKIYHTAGEPMHQEITQDGLIFLKQGPRQLIVDVHPEQELNESSRNHFDNCEFRQTVSMINSRYDGAVDSLNPSNPRLDQAGQEFGKILHAVQDFYSHSNWIEIGRTDLVDPWYSYWRDLKGYTLTTHDNPVFVLQQESDEIYPFISLIKNGKTFAVYAESLKVKGLSGVAGLVTGTYGDEGTNCLPNASIPHGDPFDPIFTWSSDEGTSYPNELNKDHPEKLGHKSARQLATQQTTHEFCRLVVLTYEKWGMPGVNLIYDNWVQNRSFLDDKCPSNEKSLISIFVEGNTATGLGRASEPGTSGTGGSLGDDGSAIPPWVKTNALWWSENQIDDKTFALAIGHLVKTDVIKLGPEFKTSSGDLVVSDNLLLPSWIKNNASWWGSGEITDNDFKQGIQFMLNEEIISFNEKLSNIKSERETDPELVKRIYEIQKGNEFLMSNLLKIKNTEVDIAEDLAKKAWEKYSEDKNQDTMNDALLLDEATSLLKHERSQVLKSLDKVIELKNKIKEIPSSLEGESYKWPEWIPEEWENDFFDLIKDKNDLSLSYEKLVDSFFSFVMIREMNELKSHRCLDPMRSCPGMGDCYLCLDYIPPKPPSHVSSKEYVDAGNDFWNDELTQKWAERLRWQMEHDNPDLLDNVLGIEKTRDVIEPKLNTQEEKLVIGLFDLDVILGYLILNNGFWLDELDVSEDLKIPNTTNAIPINDSEENANNNSNSTHYVTKETISTLWSENHGLIMSSGEIYVSPLDKENQEKCSMIRVHLVDSSGEILREEFFSHDLFPGPGLSEGTSKFDFKLYHAFKEDPGPLEIRIVDFSQGDSCDLQPKTIEINTSAKDNSQTTNSTNMELGNDPTENCSVGYELVEGECVTIECDEGYELVDNVCKPIIESDTTPPIITIPSDITVESTADTFPVSFPVDATDDVDGIINPTCNPPSGSNFPVGTTTVTCTATDNAGNTAQESFLVTVKKLEIITYSYNIHYEHIGSEIEDVWNFFLTVEDSNENLISSAIMDLTFTSSNGSHVNEPFQITSDTNSLPDANWICGAGGYSLTFQPQSITHELFGTLDLSSEDSFVLDCSPLAENNNSEGTPIIVVVYEGHNLPLAQFADLIMTGECDDDWHLHSKLFEALSSDFVWVPEPDPVCGFGKTDQITFSEVLMTDEEIAEFESEVGVDPRLNAPYTKHAG